MAILSKIKSAVKKVVSTVKSAFGGSSNTASVSNALQAPAKGSFVASQQKPYTGQGQNTSRDIATYGISKIASGASGSGNLVSSAISKAGGSTTAPTSYKNLMTPSSFAPGTTSSKSNYSSSSYMTPYSAPSGASSFAISSPVSTTVNAGSIGTGTPSSSIGSAPTNYQGTAIGGNVSVGAEPTTGYIPTASVTGTTGEETKPEKAKTSLETLLASLRKPADEADAYAKAQRESGLLQAQQRVANTQNEVNAVTAKMNSDLLQLRGTAQKEGVTEAVYGGQQAQITREATIRLLPLQAQLANDQGNLELAESHLDTLFKVYSKDAQNSVDYYNNLAKLVYDDATTSEKRQLDEQARNKDFERSLLKDNINFQQSTASQALKDGNVRLYKAITAVQPPTNINSPTYAQDKQNYLDDINEAVGKYGQVAAETGSYTPKQLTALSKLNQDVSKNATYSKTTSMRNYGDNVIASLQLGSGVGDISAINQFQKVIDEGAVTRDQDVKLIQGSQSLVNSLKTKIKKLEKGEQLSPQLRLEMRSAVEAMYNKQVEALQKDPYIKSKTKEAGLYGLKPSDTILGELGAFTQESTQQGSNIDYTSTLDNIFK